MRHLTWVSDGTFTGVAALKESARPAAAWWVPNRNWTVRVGDRRWGDALRHCSDMRWYSEKRVV
jgi:hypothetical protein